MAKTSFLKGASEIAIYPPTDNSVHGGSQRSNNHTHSDGLPVLLFAVHFLSNLLYFDTCEGRYPQI